MEIENTIYGKETFVDMKTLSLEVVDYYEALQEAGGDITGIPSGYGFYGHNTGTDTWENA